MAGESLGYPPVLPLPLQVQECPAPCGAGLSCFSSACGLPQLPLTSTTALSLKELLSPLGTGRLCPGIRNGYPRFQLVIWLHPR